MIAVLLNKSKHSIANEKRKKEKETAKHDSEWKEKGNKLQSSKSVTNAQTSSTTIPFAQ